MVSSCLHAVSTSSRWYGRSPTAHGPSATGGGLKAEPNNCPCSGIASLLRPLQPLLRERTAPRAAPADDGPAFRLNRSHGNGAALTVLPAGLSGLDRKEQNLRRPHKSLQLDAQRPDPTPSVSDGSP